MILSFHGEKVYIIENIIVLFLIKSQLAFFNNFFPVFHLKKIAQIYKTHHNKMFEQL